VGRYRMRGFAGIDFRAYIQIWSRFTRYGNDCESRKSSDPDGKDSIHNGEIVLGEPTIPDSAW